MTQFKKRIVKSFIIVVGFFVLIGILPHFLPQIYGNDDFHYYVSNLVKDELFAGNFDLVDSLSKKDLLFCFDLASVSAPLSASQNFDTSSMNGTFTYKIINTGNYIEVDWKTDSLENMIILNVLKVE